MPTRMIAERYASLSARGWSVPPDGQDRYTIRFEKEGTFTSQADCNQLAGSWEAPGSDRMTITPGPMTMASCGELSFDILYAGLLGQVQTWNVASTGMSLTLADGGRLDYTSVVPPSPSPSPSATPEPTQTPTATATVTAKLTPSPTPTPGPDLTGRAWLLTAFAFTAQADCSTVNGTYSPANPSDPRGALSLVPGHATIKACGEDSYGDLYITGIANTASFTLGGEALVLTLVDSGTLEYR